MRDSNSRPLGPKPSALAIWANSRNFTFFRMVGVGGLEPPTSPLSEVRSNRLSYTPIIILNYLVVPRGRIELPTQGFSGLCSTTELPWLKKSKWVYMNLNIKCKRKIKILQNPDRTKQKYPQKSDFPPFFTYFIDRRWHNYINSKKIIQL